MKKTLNTIVALGGLVVAGSASAALISTSVSTSTLLLNDVDYLNPAGPGESKWFLFADTDEDGFDGLGIGPDNKVLTGGSFALDSDDALLGDGTTSEAAFGTVEGSFQFDNEADGIEVGDATYLLVFGTNADTLGEDVPFFVFLDGGAADTVPASGNLSFNQISSQGFIGNPEFSTAIPEPTSLALLGLGGLLIARRRRG